jgi:mRNA interferase HicA
LSDTVIMKGSEFIKKVKKLAKERGIKAYIDKKRGKGSHVTLYFGENFTIVRNLKDELKTGTLNAMLNQLGLTEDEI